MPQVTVKPPNPNKGKTVVDLHGKKYQFAKKRIDEENKNVKEIRKIKLYMTSSKIECLKHNSSLDEECQNFGSFKAIIQMSVNFDGKSSISILNHKPVAMPEAAAEVDRQGILHEKTDEEIYYPKYKDYQECKSSSSCDIKEIEGIVYGGFSSRFWMLRKHFNALSKDELNTVPFYSWQCITLALPNRDVDLVIHSEKHMSYFLKYLVSEMETVDGRKGSGAKIIQALNTQMEEEYAKATGRESATDQAKNEINDKNRHMLMRKIYMKYLLMRVRAKIAFMALQKRMTIVELFADAMLRCYTESVRCGYIEGESVEMEKKQDDLFQQCLAGQSQGFFMKIMELNNLSIGNEVIKSGLRTRRQQTAGKQQITVVKNGEPKQQEVDHDKNQSLRAEIQSVLHRDNCYDLFQNIVQIISSLKAQGGLQQQKG